MANIVMPSESLDDDFARQNNNGRIMDIFIKEQKARCVALKTMHIYHEFVRILDK